MKEILSASIFSLFFLGFFAASCKIRSSSKVSGQRRGDGATDIVAKTRDHVAEFDGFIKPFLIRLYPYEPTLARVMLSSVAERISFAQLVEGDCQHGGRPSRSLIRYAKSEEVGAQIIFCKDFMASVDSFYEADGTSKKAINPWDKEADLIFAAWIHELSHWVIDLANFGNPDAQDEEMVSQLEQEFLGLRNLLRESTERKFAEKIAQLRKRRGVFGDSFQNLFALIDPRLDIDWTPPGENSPTLLPLVSVPILKDNNKYLFPILKDYRSMNHMPYALDAILGARWAFADLPQNIAKLPDSNKAKFRSYLTKEFATNLPGIYLTDFTQEKSFSPPVQCRAQNAETCESARSDNLIFKISADKLSGEFLEFLKWQKSKTVIISEEGSGINYFRSLYYGCTYPSVYQYRSLKLACKDGANDFLILVNGL